MVTDDWGFFGIRLESIGGYGAHIAGRILSEAGILYQGFGGSNFSSYGSEKKGTPVKAYVRFCAADHEVRTSEPVEEPHVIAVFHEALARTQPVIAGLRPDGVVLLNTRKSAAAARQLLHLDHGAIGVVDAIGIALQEKSRANMVMLGAICRVVPFLDPEAVRTVIRDTFEKKYPHSIAGNLKAFDRGYHEVVCQDAPQGNVTLPARTRRPGPTRGYLNAPIGGAILAPGSSVHRDLSASRQGQLPEFLREKCIDCAQCDIACPDMCFVWEQGADKRGKPALVLKGIDYQYCKGCLKCVEACPTDALLTRIEDDGWADTHRIAQRFAGQVQV